MAITYDFGNENEYVKDANGDFQKANRFDLYGLSSDSKPTDGNVVGCTFFEADTSKVYMWTGAAWREL